MTNKTIKLSVIKGEFSVAPIFFNKSSERVSSGNFVSSEADVIPPTGSGSISSCSPETAETPAFYAGEPRLTAFADSSSIPCNIMRYVRRKRCTGFYSKVLNKLLFGGASSIDHSDFQDIHRLDLILQSHL
jgi:hypothetical protein